MRLLALAFIALLLGGALLGLILEGADDWRNAVAAFDVPLWRAARFTLWQASLSTLLSVLPAIPVARALSRQRSFPGRSIVLALFAVPLALPAIVAALGLLALYGRAGLLAHVLGGLGAGQWPGIYGLSGILVAHVFFNLPLGVRLLLGALDAVPADRWRLAAQLGMPAGATFRLIEWPVMRAALPGAASLVFLLCVTSFTLVLTLGGGPAATTVEVAIYQALRFDFDPARAVALTVVQIALTAAFLAVLSRFGRVAVEDQNLGIATRRYVSPSLAETLLNAALIVLAALFVAAPMAAIVLSGLRADLPRLATDSAVLAATLTSLLLAGLAAALCLAMALSLSGARRTGGGAFARAFQSIAGSGAAYVLVVPPVVVGAGWFVLLVGRADVFAVAPLMVVAVNSVMALPFALRVVRPASEAARARHDRLCASLGIVGWNRLRLVDWPALRRPALTGFAFAMALSLGDLGVIALFGSDRVKTLPFLLYERMGSYRTADAAGLALMLGLLCLLLMAVVDRSARRPA